MDRSGATASISPRKPHGVTKKDGVEADEYTPPWSSVGHAAGDGRAEEPWRRRPMAARPYRSRKRNLTRFAREKCDHFALRAHLKSLGIPLRSATEPIDDTSAAS